MKELKITWQRLISEGDTCPRCGSTEKELNKAVIELKKRGINVALKKIEIAMDEFTKNPLESNLIIFNGKPLEQLLNAKVGQSKCCSVCGENNCRTLELNGKSHEIITAETIMKAALEVLNK